MATTLPANQVKTNVDAGTDDPKLARVDFAGNVDKFNTLNGALGAAALLNAPASGGLATSAQAGGTPDDLVLGISGLTELTAIDRAADFIPVYDASGAVVRKAKPANITPGASATVKGIVERATDAEAASGTDTTRYVTPKQLADNGGLGAPDFTSAEQTTTPGTTLTVAHSLPSIPGLVYVVLRCKTADRGFSVGDEVDQAHSGVGGSEGLSWAADATNIQLTYGSGGITVLRQDAPVGAGVAITSGRWKVVIRAWI